MVPEDSVNKVALVYNTGNYLYRFRRELIETLRQHGFSPLAVVPDDRYRERLEKLNLRTVTYPIKGRSLNPMLDARTFVQLSRIFRREKPSVVVNFTIKPVIYGSLTARMSGVENIYSIMTGLGHIFGAETLSRRMLKAAVVPAYRHACRANKCVFFQNKEDRELFEQEGIVPPEKAKIISGSGVNLTDYKPTTGNVTKQSFLLIARIIEEKGIREYVQAAQAIRKEYPNAVFRLLGPLERNTSITRSEVRRWTDQNVIEYLGETQDVRPYLANTAVFVLPSYYKEGIPRSILEALAMAKPVITTDWPGCRETVVDGQNGFLVPARSTHELVNKMRIFLDNPDLIESMGSESRKRAVERFDVHAVNALILSTIQEGLAH